MNATRRAMLLGVAGSAGALTACGGAGGGPGASAGDVLPKPSAQPMELRVSTDTSIQNLPGWQNAAKGYEQKYPTRKVNLEHLTSGLIDKIIAQQPPATRRRSSTPARRGCTTSPLRA